MQSLKQTTPKKNEASSDTATVAESGVHTIPPGAREALKAIEAARANGQSKAEDAGKPYSRSVGPSTEPVCPKMLKAHIPLVHQVVAPIARRVPANVERDDLIAAGLFGLVDSLRRNGGDSGITFEWYARMRIRGAVLDELRAQDCLSRRARDAVNAANDGPDAEHESVTWVGFDELSANEELEYLASVRLGPEGFYEAKEIMCQLAVALDKLTERERTVVAMHYWDSATFKKIAETLKISETRAFQLHSRAMERLRSVLVGKRSSRPTLRETCSLPSNNIASDDWDDSPIETDSASSVA